MNAVRVVFEFMRPPSLLNFEWREAKEEIMFKMTKSELKTKSKLELQVLFNQVSGKVPVLQNPNKNLAKSLLAMIQCELKNREP